MESRVFVSKAIRVIGAIAALALLLMAPAACKYGQSNPLQSARLQTGIPTAHEVSVLFINVGCGDAALVRIDGLFYLIDTGEKAAAPALYRGLALLDVHRIEAVFLTHTHSDHIGGMEALSRRFDVGALYSAEISEDKKNGQNKIEELAEELNLPHTKLEAGNSIPVAQDVSFEVLGPLVCNEKDDNDNSLVLRLRINGRTLLFAGDMQFEEEATLLSAGIDLKADVLKVGNHGNPDATSGQFAGAVSPEIAVISTDTSEDADSANARVISALGSAHVYVTEDYACGVLLNVHADGEMAISNPEPEKATADIRILNIDFDAQTVTIANESDTDADLSGYFIFSEKGSEVFIFPQGSHIGSGQTLTVACIGGSGDYIWNDTNVWNGKKGDTAVLYDCFGNETSRRDL